MTDSFLDQAQDQTNRAILDVVSRHNAPAWVEAAPIEHIKGGPTTLSRNYGDPTRRLFPFHTKAACWMSCAFYADNRGQLPPETAQRVEDRLRKAAAFNGLARDFETMMARADGLEQTEKRASAEIPDDDFLWVDRNTRERRLPVRSAVEVKKAEAWLAKFRDAFTFADRCKIADRLLEKAGAFGVDVGEWVLRTAGLGVCSVEDARGLIAGRTGMLEGQGNHAIAAEFRKMSKAIAENPQDAIHTGLLIKLATLIDQADRMIEVEHDVPLAGRYSARLPRPEDVLFAVNIKSAEQYVEATVPTVLGSVYNRDSLGQIKVSAVAGLLGTELAAEMAGRGLFLDPVKAARVLRTLPRPDVKLFERAAKEAGVAPIAAPEVGDRQLTPEEIDRLAAEYQPA